MAHRLRGIASSDERRGRPSVPKKIATIKHLARVKISLERAAGKP